MVLGGVHVVVPTEVVVRRDQAVLVDSQKTTLTFTEAYSCTCRPVLQIQAVGRSYNT